MFFQRVAGDIFRRNFLRFCRTAANVRRDWAAQNAVARYPTRRLETPCSALLCLLR